MAEVPVVEVSAPVVEQPIKVDAPIEIEVSVPVEVPEVVATPKVEKPKVAKVKAPKIETERATALLPVALLKRCRAICFWTPGLTLTDFFTRALTAEADRLEAENGGSFEEAAGKLKTGRRLKDAPNT